MSYDPLEKAKREAAEAKRESAFNPIPFVLGGAIMLILIVPIFLIVQSNPLATEPVDLQAVQESVDAMSRSHKMQIYSEAEQLSRFEAGAQAALNDSANRGSFDNKTQEGVARRGTGHGYSIEWKKLRKKYDLSREQLDFIMREGQAAKGLREGHRRDHLWLQWKNDENLTGEQIREKWNAMPPDARKRISRRWKAIDTAIAEDGSDEISRALIAAQRDNENSTGGNRTNDN